MNVRGLELRVRGNEFEVLMKKKMDTALSFRVCLPMVQGVGSKVSKEVNDGDITAFLAWLLGGMRIVSGLGFRVTKKRREYLL